MNLYVEIDGRRTLRGSYPDNNSPHIAAAAERNAKSWLDGGYRVWFDDREVGVVSAETMAATRTQFEVVTTPPTARAYATVTDDKERIAA